jgi:membrane protein DedA with SNARE-associated domain
MDFLQSFVSVSPHLAYLILFFGMFIEGEAFFLTAAIFALEGYLSWQWIVIVSFLGVILGDIIWYLMGRYSKSTRLGGWVSGKFQHYQDWLLENFNARYLRLAFFSKFLYYVNRLTPLLAGWQKMDFKQFLKVHLIAAIAWISTMFVAGKFFGLVIDAIGVNIVLDRLYWFFALLAVLVIGGEYLMRRLFIKKIKQ